MIQTGMYSPSPIEHRHRDLDQRRSTFNSSSLSAVVSLDRFGGMRCCLILFSSDLPARSKPAVWVSAGFREFRFAGRRAPVVGVAGPVVRTARRGDGGNGEEKHNEDS